ncbi:FAD-dependent monooxygenase [Pseudonocardia humida]|uniref:FAD-dependent monooxygenase n=1 Tax=Pseudonocardia humida TaxID=2800819 RepID=A0ABT1AA15_9PSEU|nr:FAD-dependent monooxygenase [Pseudonocardia humida]MCO1659857.1 FAD-dependent monooxygenase [Pseudonocardia humida]
MQLRRVAVLGGGPAGLYAARLLKLAQPRCEVVVHEQGERDTTFGFGVGLAAGTQRKLEAADADTLRDIRAAGRPHDMTMDVGGAVARVRNDNLIGIARTELLDVLQRHAEKAGVRLEHGVRPAADDLDADVVLAADGVGSATREAGGFGASVELGRGLFLWCGAGFALDDAVFAPVDTEHGTFVTHAYPYADDRSTFLIETDEPTWRAACLDTAVVEGDASDTASLAHLREVFRTHLRGHDLIGNRTRWQRFRTVTCRRWSAGRVVLLGDAAHTAHFSIGSGTKLAMEDAIALVAALDAEPDPPAAFARYEAVRRPAVERLQELARRSRLWWESFPSRTHLPVERLMISYMTRAGNIPLDRFAATSPEVVGAALGQFAGVAPQVPPDLTDWVLRSRVAPDDLDALVVDAVLDDPWGVEADAVVAAAAAAAPAALRVVGPPERPALLTRLDLAERLRTEVGATVVVEGPPDLRDDLAAGLVSGRADLVGVTGSTGSGEAS